MTQCVKIIVGFTADVGNVFYPTFRNAFFYFLHVFYVLKRFFFKFSSQRLLHLCLLTSNRWLDESQ